MEELIALESVSDLPPVEAGASVLQQRAWRGVHDVVQAARAAGLDAAGAARPFLAEVRCPALRAGSPPAVGVAGLGALRWVHHVAAPHRDHIRSPPRGSRVQPSRCNH